MTLAPVVAPPVVVSTPPVRVSTPPALLVVRLTAPPLVVMLVALTVRSPVVWVTLNAPAAALFKPSTVSSAPALLYVMSLLAVLIRWATGAALAPLRLMPAAAVAFSTAAVSTPAPVMAPVVPVPAPLAVRVSAAPPEAVKPVPRVMLPLLSNRKPPVTVVGLMVPVVVWMVPV